MTACGEEDVDAYVTPGRGNVFTNQFDCDLSKHVTSVQVDLGLKTGPETPWVIEMELYSDALFSHCYGQGVRNNL